MSLILVVEPEPRHVERIKDALGADGWKLQAVPGHAEALAAVASQSPDLILVSAAAAGAERVVADFSRHAGGPGVLVLLAEGDVAGADRFGGEDHLGKPFTAQELRLAVKRAMLARREPAPAPAPAAGPDEPKLTSHEIFGDLLAEVEDEVSGALRSRRPRPATQVQPPAAAPAAAGTPPPAAAVPPATAVPPAATLVPAAPQPPAGTRPPAAAASADDEIQRRLEETLSGLLGTESRPAAPVSSAAPRAGTAAAPAAPATAAPQPRKPGQAKPGADVDALISRTLTGLNLEKDLGKGKPAPAGAPPAAKPASPAAEPPRAAAPRPASTDAVASPAAPPPRAAARPPSAAAIPITPPAPATVPPPASAAPPSAAPPRAERTGVSRPPLKFDLQDFEELTKSRRVTGAIKTATPTSSGPARTAPAGETAAPAAATPPPADPAATVRIPVFRPEETGQQGERFGQYTLLERIAVGGMAELYKARMSGVEGFQKTVAIKRILPHLTDNAEFLEMFIDEGKLAAQLTHPNIAHIYDLGKIGRDYYIAMEYVEGKDLRSVLNQAKRKGLPVPFGLSLLIVARLASALDHAHRKRDFEGREMGLVHRDVSPQNVLLTFEGDIKLVDFGIAKAVSKASQTQMGALKGKLQYMSPEQAWGRAVDPRSDIFSLGAVLFELLTGERLFAGDSEISVLEAVREGKVRPLRDINPSVPAEVEALVMHALAVEPGDRFATAGELQQRLEEILYSMRPTPGHSDLAAYLERLFEAGPAAETAAAPATPEVAAAPARPTATSIPPPPRQAQAAAAEPPPAAATTGPTARPAAPPPAADSVPLRQILAPPPLPEPTPLSEPPPLPTPVLAAVPPAVPALVPAPGLGAAAALEERGGKGRVLLAAMVAVAVAGVLIWFLVGRSRGAAAPGTAAVPPAATVEAVVPPAGAPPPAAAAAQPAAPAPAGAVDMEKIVNQELARREEQLRRRAEEERRRLERELEASRAREKAPAPASPAPAPEERVAAAIPAQQPPAPAPAEPVAHAQSAAAEPAAPPIAPPVQRVEPVPVEPVPAPAPETPAEPRTRPGDLVQPGPGVTPPQLVSYDKPKYPPMAQQLRVQGVVVVALLVDENGRVQDARVAEPIRQDVGINEAALAAARTARYRPATKEGVPVKIWTRLRIPFKL